MATSLFGNSSFGHEIPNNDSTSFKRRASLPVPRQTNIENEKEWTAARCHRLLRPLTSRIAILEKERSRFPAQCKRPAEVELEGAQGEQPCSNVETGWTRTAKRIRHTYGKESRRELAAERLPNPTKGRKSLPGEIVLPTPILKNTQWQKSRQTAIPFILDGQWKELKDGALKQDVVKSKAHLQTARALRDVRQSTNPAQFGMYEGLYNGLEALLKGTMSEMGARKAKAKGARSLMSMCLRAVPQGIMEEEQRLEAEKQELGRDTLKISQEIYQFLESVSSTGRGWTQLKGVVRAHGILIISQAIASKVIEVGFSEVLIELCVQSGALDEAETLLSSLLCSAQLPPPTSIHSRFRDDLKLRPLIVLRDFVDQTSRTSFQHAQLSKLISSGAFHIAWLATRECQYLWTGLMHDMAQEAARANAMKLLDSALCLLGTEECQEQRQGELAKALENTYISILTTLLTITILSKEVDGSATNVHMHEATPHEVVLRYLAVDLRTTMNITSRQILLLVADLLIGHKINSSPTCDVSDPPPAHQSLLSQHEDRTASMVDQLLYALQSDFQGSIELSSPQDYLAHFISCVARCCGRGTSTSGFDHLRGMHQSLKLLLADVKISKGASVLKEAIISSAFDFSQHISDRKHLNYAADINKELHGTGQGPNPLHGQASVEGRIGFRWEEGISEWVTATPALKAPKFIDPTLDTAEVEHETPFRRKMASKTIIRPGRSRQLRSSRSTSQQKPSNATLPTRREQMPFGPNSSPRAKRILPGRNGRGQSGGGKTRQSLASSVSCCTDSEGDDELSFEHTDSVLVEISNNKVPRGRQIFQTKNQGIAKSTAKAKLSRVDDSEDELC